MTEERCLRVPYQVLGAVTGWVVSVLLMIAATVQNSDSLERWSLLVVAAASVLSGWCMLTRSRIRTLDAIDLQLRMHDQALAEGANGVPRIPTPLR